MASQGGRENIVFLKSGKCLKRWNVGSELSIASTIGALNSGASIASTDLSKQKVVTVSIAKHRNAKSMSEEWPLMLFLVKISAR